MSLYSISVGINDVPDLFVLSDMLQMAEVKEACVDQLMLNLCESNCLGNTLLYDFMIQ